MQKLVILFVFLMIGCPVVAQSADDVWMQQVMSQVDEETLSESDYSQLMELLEELRQARDTVRPRGPQLRQQLAWRSDRCLSAQAGYGEAGTFRGDPWRHQLRYRMRYGAWRVGLSAETDAGEPWRRTFPGADSWHAFLSYAPTRRRWLQQAVVGHFRVRSGCGLVLNQQVSFGKMMSAEQMMSNRTVQVSGHGGMSEDGYLQGAALQLRLARAWQLMLFGSARQVDGTLKMQTDANGQGSTPILTALQGDGLHRTAGEEGHRHAAWQVVGGGRLSWQTSWLEMGASFLSTQFQHDYIRPERAYNASYFRGHSLLQGSFDYRMRAFGGQWAGEVAVDDGGGLAVLNMLGYTVASDWRLTLSHRYYGDGYRQLLARSMSETSEMQGEQGATLMLAADLSRRWSLQFMADYFYLSHPQYGFSTPGQHGAEAMLRMLYKRSALQAQLAYRLKRKNDYLRQGLDVRLDWTVCERLRMATFARGRIYNVVSGKYSLGGLVSQQVMYDGPLRGAFGAKAALQATFFATDDYDSRLWIAERQVTYGFGLPMLYGRGCRLSLTATVADSRPLYNRKGLRWGADLKYAWTYYTDRSAISSGPTMIDAPWRHDLWLQVRLEW